MFRTWAECSVCRFLVGPLVSILSISVGSAFEVGIFSSAGSGALEEIAEAGFDFVRGGGDERFVHLARERGLEAIPVAGAFVGEETDWCAFSYIVDRFDSIEGLGRLFLTDEPDLNRLDARTLDRARGILAGAGNRLGGAISYVEGRSVRRYGREGDWAFLDVYPVGWAPLSTLGDEVAQAVDIAGDGVKVFAAIQAFDWNYFSEELVVAGRFRAPSYRELRFLVFDSIVKGASGVAFYTYQVQHWRLNENPDLWSSVAAVTSEIQALKPVLTGRRIEGNLRVRFEKPSLRYNGVRESAVDGCLFDVQGDDSRFRSGLYFLGVNTTPYAVEVDVFCRSFESEDSVSLIGEESALSVSRGSIRMDMEPYDVIMLGPIGR